MFNAFEDMQKVSKDNMDTAVKSFGALSKSAQAIAVEAADYAKKSFEHNTAHVERLMGVKTLDKAIELNSDFAKTAYEGFVAQSTKMGEMMTDLSKEMFKPVEVAFAKVQAPK
jgi:phasin family protein